MMKKFLFWMVAAILTFGALFTSCARDVDNPVNPSPDPTPTEDLAEYTLFIYGHAGGRMDRIIDSVYDEMKPLLTDKKKVRVLFFYKYGHSTPNEAFTSEYANEDEVLRFELTAETDLSKLRTEACFEEKSKYQLYNTQNLTEQLNWVAETAPAKHYIVMLYGHGAGFNAKDDYYKMPSTSRAVLYDEGFDGQGMNMYEFKWALEESAIKHPQMIFCHNCLMGNLESLTTLRNLTDYFVASQHLLASNGYIITEFVKSLQQTTDIEAATKRLFSNLDPWRELYGPMNGDLICIKSQAIENINEQMDYLCGRLCDIYPAQREAIDKATCSVYRPYPNADLYDAVDYAACLARETNDGQLKAICASLNAAFDDAILVRTHVNNKEERLDNYSLSVTIVDKATFAQQYMDGDWPFTYEDSYKATDFHANTGWGHWLSTNEQAPTGNPSGYVEGGVDDDEDEVIDNLVEKIKGKWMMAEVNGQPVLTNAKQVLTYESESKFYYSLSISAISDLNVWVNHCDGVFDTNGNTLAQFVELPQANIKFLQELNILSITDNEMEVIVNNETLVGDQSHRITKDLRERKVRVTHDYSADIIGIWEGRLTSDQDAYSDNQLHRWEYKADGTFVYYRQDKNGEWVADVNTMAEYFVDGTLLCSRWKNVGDDTEKRESWEIESIVNGQMNWIALRQNEDGSTYTARFSMTRVK